MKLGQHATNKLRAFLTAVASAKGSPVANPVFAWPRGAGVDGLLPLGEMRRLGLTMECLDALQQDRGLQYLSRDELRDAVNDLVTEIRNEHTGADGTPRFIDHLIKTFGTTYVRAETDFEFAFAIDGLEVAADTQDVGQGRVSCWTEKDSDSWNVQDGRESFIDHTVVVVAGRGVTVDLAFVEARRRVDTVLGLLRACLGYSVKLEHLLTTNYPNRVTQGRGDGEYPPIFEQQLSFRWNGDILVRVTSDTSGTTLQRLSYPTLSPPQLTGQALNYVTEALTYLNQFVQTTPSGSYGPEFQHAIEWIGSSVTRPTPDDKVVDLCTALECVLCTKGDKRKGEAITIRQMVLGKAIQSDTFETPHILFGLYEMRGDIVHGSGRHVASNENAAQLMTVALSAMIAIVRLGQLNSTPFTKAAKLVAYLDRQSAILRQIRSELTGDFLTGEAKAYHIRNIPPTTKDIHDKLVAFIGKTLEKSTSA